MEAEIPPEFDWVTARSTCNAQTLFEQLRETVKTDCETAKALPSRSVQLQGVTFDPGSETAFGVIVKEPLGWTLGRYGIELNESKQGAPAIIGWKKEGRQEGARVFLARPKLLPNGDCRFEVEGKFLTAWQVSRLAFEELFFRND